MIYATDHRFFMISLLSGVFREIIKAILRIQHDIACSWCIAARRLLPHGFARRDLVSLRPTFSISTISKALSSSSSSIPHLLVNCSVCRGRLERLKYTAMLESVIVVHSRLRVLDALVFDISGHFSRPGSRTMFNVAIFSAAHHSSLLAPMFHISHYPLPFRAHHISVRLFCRC